jgi:uncharacterized protein (DUF1499 family)
MSNTVPGGWTRWSARLGWLAVALAFLGLILGMAAGLGTRAEWWDFREGFDYLRYGIYAGLAALVLGLFAVLGHLLAPPAARLAGWIGFVLITAGGAGAVMPILVPQTAGWPVAWGFTLLGLGLVSLLFMVRDARRFALIPPVVAMGLAAVWVYTPFAQIQIARSVPPIHDITTDTQNPPEFVAIAPLRADAPNPLAYPGEEVAAQQRAAYPHIAPVTFDAPPGEVFDRALAAARAMGWEIVATAPAEGRIEAPDTTFWFGFKDDVVIRIAAVEEGRTRLDVRSKSRVGMSDVGKNAARIEAFLRKLGT